MAQVIVADKAGACFGVERAIELVRAAAAHAEGDVFTLGPLIHNPRVVDELEHAGDRRLPAALFTADCDMCVLALVAVLLTPDERWLPVSDMQSCVVLLARI
jgi:4-hydroxy-3-methylbut-2-enyl diphosphate reductase